MSQPYDTEAQTNYYLALTREELVARCLTKDRAMELLVEQRDAAQTEVRELQRKLAIGRTGL